MNLGFKYATESGLSICLDDVIVPADKQFIIEDAHKKQKEYYESSDIDEHGEPVMTLGERKKVVIDLWCRASKAISDETKNAFSKVDNSIHMFVDSGARGSFDYLACLAGMKGLVEKSSGEINETPITASLKEGLSSFQYFISTHGSRKGLADTALKTANSGYLTRRLVDVTQDIVITEEDCGTLDGVFISAIHIKDTPVLSFEQRTTGRFSADEIIHPVTGEIILLPNKEITETKAKNIFEAGIDKIKIRSVLTCQTRNGVCARCYGEDLSKGEIVTIGEAVGIIAAQSIGEPGTQLMMRSKHLGGILIGLPRIAELFEARKSKDNSSINIHSILEEAGLRAAQSALLNELQIPYCLQQVCINDKHFEIIIRKMTEKIKIEDPGDTLFQRGETVHRQLFIEKNTQVQFDGGKPALGKPIILGITKASLSSGSWISAASFQDTTKVLTHAAISGAVDGLRGLKENIIMGRLIPAGTGMDLYKSTFVESHYEDDE